MDSLKGKYIIEFYQIGNSVKVSAIDPETQIETCIIGPASLSQEELSQNAIRKLEYILANKA
ncbi:MAG: hypothetical protein MK137_01850 [Rickettsiales bacterium]|nr:hypothetical protein [Rickettsiales bacterium]